METNAEAYIKVENPKRQNVPEVGCSLYDEMGNLLKTYSESCSFTTSYVNYTCNFNTDMGYKLLPGTTYKFNLYVIVGGKKIVDTMRTFNTSGLGGATEMPEDKPAETAKGKTTTEIKLVENQAGKLASQTNNNSRASTVKNRKRCPD